MTTAYQLQSEIGKRIKAIQKKYDGLIEAVELSNIPQPKCNQILFSLNASRRHALDSLSSTWSIIDETLHEMEAPVAAD